MKKKKTISIILFSFLFLSSLGMVLAVKDSKKAVRVDSTQVVQKEIVPEKQKVQVVRPGDVDPADAAAAGYQETSTVGPTRTRIYEVKTAYRTFLFSEVEGSLPPNNLGYFRVLDRYGYGRENENVRNHLIFGARTEMPGSKNPLRVLGSYVFLFFGDSIDLFAVYYDGPYESRGLFFLRAWVPEEQEIKDLDGDGRLEFQAFGRIKGSIPPEIAAVGKILTIYRFVPNSDRYGCAKFVSLKGKPYENIFLEHAKQMKDQKMIMAWLAAVESAENSQFISEAMDEFWKLPSLKEEVKKKIIGILVDNGFTGLKPYDRNPQ
jgi:hypothetical protein